MSWIRTEIQSSPLSGGSGRGAQVLGCTTDMENLPQDYYKPVSEMKDKELWMSTLTEDSRPKSFGDNKICLLCGFQYYFRPSRFKEHLGVTCAPVKMVQKCKPLPQHVKRYTHIVEDLQQRQLHARHKTNRQGREHYNRILTVLSWGRRLTARTKWFVGLVHSRVLGRMMYSC